MRKIEIYAIHYDTPSRQQAPFGGISKEFVCGRDDMTGDNIVNLGTYADMRAPYWIWKNRDDYDIIGFHGYRKFLDFFKPPEYGTPRWHDVNLTLFREYQKWLVDDPVGAQHIQELLAQHDIIVAPAFDCSYNVDMVEDFRRSRSPADWKIVEGKLSMFNLHTPFIRPMHFVTRAAVFNRFMEWWWPIAEDIRGRIKSEDVRDLTYLARPMAYISERMYSLWLDASKLSFVEVPLLQCWEAK